MRIGRTCPPKGKSETLAEGGQCGCRQEYWGEGRTLFVTTEVREQDKGRGWSRLVRSERKDREIGWGRQGEEATRG